MPGSRLTTLAVNEYSVLSRDKQELCSEFITHALIENYGTTRRSQPPTLLSTT